MHYKTLCGLALSTWQPLLTAAQMSQATKKQNYLLGIVKWERGKSSISSLYCIHQLGHMCSVSVQRKRFIMLGISQYNMALAFVRQEERTVCQEDKRSAISWRSNLFWAASITPLHSALTRTSLMIAAACPVGSSDVLLNMNICTTLRQSIKLFY